MNPKLRLNKKYTRIRFILGDQLNHQHTWFQETRDDTLYVLAEMPSELNYVKHHIQKICAFFAAMENFSHELSENGHHLLWLSLEETHEFVSLASLMNHLIAKYQCSHFEYQQPDEYRLLKSFETLQSELPENIKIKCFDTEHFCLDFQTLPEYFPSKKSVLMESFYRKMRKRFGYLMEEGKPLKGRWNYDAENRSKLKAADMGQIPTPLCFDNKVQPILERLRKYKISYFGKVEEVLLWPISRQQSLALLDFFCEHCLKNFGRFQDAMTLNSTHSWSLYHARISFSLNSKMLSPREVITRAITAFEKNTAEINLAQIEGFVRQILGWREYVRGIYWANMPEYQTKNHLRADRNLPEYFWSGKTKMKCMSACLTQSLDYSYAHHIQRLMVIGNFCLLTGIDPNAVDEWYLGVYIDAIEWVEMPNTRGMSQFADGGLLGSKPYCASGSYINKMSDFCKSCHYKVKEKTSELACPFNSLYWHFINRHQDKFANNPRMGMTYRTWEKMGKEKQIPLIEHADYSLENLENL